ncbi:hypothetical protein B0T24DRAFT_289884 [Lasiosphaeria ovina]|uniref:Uncharacterized protein n=1 Tax=Lasiosphaeria ovina TaxID=92902 RepID=A0AAE0KE09_9PEZI|nr:hypothetical protein B0T24DRAFT_289884 [Lasiosphaeria ovina]
MCAAPDCATVLSWGKAGARGKVRANAPCSGCAGCNFHVFWCDLSAGRHSQRKRHQKSRPQRFTICRKTQKLPSYCFTITASQVLVMLATLSPPRPGQPSAAVRSEQGRRAAKDEAPRGGPQRQSKFSWNPSPTSTQPNPRGLASSPHRIYVVFDVGMLRNAIGHQAGHATAL